VATQAFVLFLWVIGVVFFDVRLIDVVDVVDLDVEVDVVEPVDLDVVDGMIIWNVCLRKPCDGESLV